MASTSREAESGPLGKVSTHGLPSDAAGTAAASLERLVQLPSQSPAEPRIDLAAPRWPTELSKPEYASHDLARYLPDIVQIVQISRYLAQARRFSYLGKPEQKKRLPIEVAWVGR